MLTGCGFFGFAFRLERPSVVRCLKDIRTVRLNGSRGGLETGHAQTKVAGLGAVFAVNIHFEVCSEKFIIKTFVFNLYL